MSLVELEGESVIGHIVEAMLPRFSDGKLGLLIGIDMAIWDNGYGKDGNTRERREKRVRKYLYFLFVRPSNYTKVFFWEPKINAVGLDCSPLYSLHEWFMVSDHDSCWRDGCGSKMTDVYMNSCRKFESRKICPHDLSKFITFISDPAYMHLDVYEQKDKKADRFSTEGRVWNIKLREADYSELVRIYSLDTKRLATSGLMIKGSEDLYGKC